MKKSVRYTFTPRLGRVSSIAVSIATTIRNGTETTMIQMVLRTARQKYGSASCCPWIVPIPNMNR